MAAIRAALAKGRSSGDAVLAAANQTAQELEERIREVHHLQKESSAQGGGTGISPARVTTVLLKSISTSWLVHFLVL